MKKNAKKSKIIHRLLQKCESKLRVTLSVISPTLASRYLFRRAFNSKLNLKNPQTFNEKLIWLKLNTYYDNPLVTQCADKYRVRDYVEKCGLKYILNDLIDAWDTVDEINWDKLPSKFAIKCNHGSGYNIICDSKKDLNIKETNKTIQSWLDEDYWKYYAEVNYKFINKKIICERYLDSDQGFLPVDYKIYCFHGVPKAILVMFDRDNETKGIFMDVNWGFLSTASKYKEIKEIPAKPQSLDKMLDAAVKLSKPFPFVRVDFYQYNNNPIFGEMTFTPAGGLYVSQTEIHGKSMGDYLLIKDMVKGGE